VLIGLHQLPFEGLDLGDGFVTQLEGLFTAVYALSVGPPSDESGRNDAEESGAEDNNDEGYRVHESLYIPPGISGFGPGALPATACGASLFFFELDCLRQSESKDISLASHARPGLSSGSISTAERG